MTVRNGTSMFDIQMILQLVLWTFASANFEGTVILGIPQGRLRGIKLKTELGVPYYSFRGIPYAKPPVGPLRFKLPEPAEPWEGIRVAVKEPPVCPQYIWFNKTPYRGTEDCLFINVFTPQIPNNDTMILKPVMVYIHGGCYNVGSGNNELHGPGLIMSTSEVVLVTFNYRLGPLGFLSTGDSVMPGNNGMKDQVLALKWVQHNIAHFGGDPLKVTIAGISAGAAATHSHVLSPMSKGLFHKAIAQSACAFCPWSTLNPDFARRRTFRLGETLGINTNDSQELMERLMNIPAKDLIIATNLTTWYEELLPIELFYAPVIEVGGEPETTFLPDLPINMIRNKRFNDVPLILGVTSKEGKLIFPMSEYMLNNTRYNHLREDFAPFIRTKMQLEEGTKETLEITKHVREYYFQNRPVSKQTWPELTELYGDIIVVIWLDRCVKEHAKVNKNPLYYYQFSFTGEKDSHPWHNITGVMHAFDLHYLFVTPYILYNVSDPDNEYMKMSKVLIKMWTNFAKTGNPTPEKDDRLGGITWEPFKINETNYLNIDRKLSMHKDLAKGRMDFWNTIYPPRTELNITRIQLSHVSKTSQSPTIATTTNLGIQSQPNTSTSEFVISHTGSTLASTTSGNNRSVVYFSILSVLLFITSIV